MGLRVHIAKDRRDFLPLQRVRRGDESVRRHDDFSTQSERADGDLQRHRGIAHGDAMFDAREFRDPALEFLDQGPSLVSHGGRTFRQRAPGTAPGRRHSAGRRAVFRRKRARRRRSQDREF